MFFADIRWRVSGWDHDVSDCQNDGINREILEGLAGYIGETYRREMKSADFRVNAILSAVLYCFVSDNVRNPCRGPSGMRRDVGSSIGRAAK